MEPIEILSNEHGLMRQILEVLSMAAETIHNRQPPSETLFEKGVEVARSLV
jgi:hypothetical protein